MGEKNTSKVHHVPSTLPLNYSSGYRILPQMELLNASHGPVPCFVTVGKGLEEFAKIELEEKGMVITELGLAGKVIFLCPRRYLHLLHCIKTAERLFVLVDNRHNTIPKRDKEEAQRKLFNLFRYEVGGWEKRRLDCELIRQLAPVRPGAPPTALPPQLNRKRKIPQSNDTGTLSLVLGQDLRTEATVESDQIGFRVNCKVSSGKLSAEEMGRCIGSAVSISTGWVPDLRFPDWELSVHLNRTHCLSGLSVMHAPLSLRTYLRYTGLRSPVCAAMCRLLNLAPGNVLLDPMCGAATLLLEAAMTYPGIFCIGVDSDLSQIAKAKENFNTSGLGSRVHVIQGDATRLPIAPVDAVVCDLPFGQKFGSRDDVRTLLPSVTANAFRVLGCGGRCVLLVSRELEGLVIGAITAHKIRTKLISSHFLTLGTLPAIIFVFEKLGEPPK